MRYFFLFIFIMLFCMLGFTTLPAQIPHTLSYQGVLTDSSGAPKPDGAYSFTFRLYETASGGSSIWSETENLTVKRGLFNTVLGDQTAFDPAVKFDRAYWLGIQVENDPELTPRIPLTSVGYSFRSMRADTANVALVSAVDSTWKTSGSNIYRLEGNVGIGTTNPQAKLHVGGVLKLNIGEGFELLGDEVYFGGSRDARVFRMIDVNSTQGVVDGGIAIEGYTTLDNVRKPILAVRGSGNIGVGTIDPTAKLEVVGRTKTQVLEITGGADLAEPFEMFHPGPLPAGALVVIDEEHPGKLKLSDMPYDNKVAGVISGAGGINPGLTLTQQGVTEEGQNVALSGRVYALATAANGPIKPGDLLTTSSIPGHAMKATDKELRAGAVIGKAMTGLESGEGLVLVLVNLQ